LSRAFLIVVAHIIWQAAEEEDLAQLDLCIEESKSAMATLRSAIAKFD
jgi:hypothetical protein